MLRGVDGLFSAQYPIIKPQFKLYCDQLELRKRFPGVLGIGYSFRYAPEARIGFEGFMRNAAGVKNFKIHPLHDLDQHYTIVFLEPDDATNDIAIGYDMYSEPVRRAAMQRARDSGVPSASGIVQLIQDLAVKKTPAFLIYLPVYRDGVVPQTVAERKEKIRAFVYAPFRCRELLEGVFGKEIEPWLDFEVYDGPQAAPENLLYASSPAPEKSPRLMTTIPLNVEGREWTLEFRTRPNFQPLEAKLAVPATALGGGILSLALFLVTRSQVIGRLRAERLLHKLRDSQVALRRSETKFRRLSDANIVGVVFATLDGNIIDGNDAYFQIIGQTREQFRTHGGRWSDMIAPEEWPRVDRAIADLRRSGVSEPYEIDLIRPDGSRVCVLTGAATLEGTEQGVVAILIDLTKRKEAERDLLAAKNAAETAQEHAETANRLKDEFLATVSHELRTPLNAILGWTQLLRAAKADPQELDHGLSIIERNARAQAQLVDDLLDVSRIVSGKLRVDLQPLDLSNVVDSATQTIRPTADVKGVALTSEIDRDSCIVAGDAARLGQVVWNLLTNAVKFTPRGGAVDVRLKCAGDQAEITVQDTGKGIDADFMPYLFERFRQADSSSTRKYGGLGLGLGIVRHLVQLHGGTVEVHSAGENKGATFTVRLPLSPTRLTSSKGVGEPRNGAGALNGIRVLLVEDEADARELLRRFMADAGAVVSVAESAREAMQMYAHHPPHVLVSDISMPDEDGYSMLRKIRETSNGSRVPAVAVTAYARPEDRDRAIAAGYELHLAKPVHAAELVQAVAQLAQNAATP
jgi:PAS domain S-box-containing protein